MGRTERDQRGLNHSVVAPHPANVALNQAIIDSLTRRQMENQWDGDSSWIRFMDTVYSLRTLQRLSGAAVTSVNVKMIPNVSRSREREILIVSGQDSD